MATKLEGTGNVTREIATALHSVEGYKDGCTVRITADGAFLKAPNKRWVNARFLSWDEILRYAEVPKVADAAPAESAA